MPRGVYKKSEEHRRKMSETRKGRHFSPTSEFKKGHSLSEEYKEKIRIKLKGTRVGEENTAWKGGVTPEYERIRHSSEYNLWRVAVFERDHYSCVWCGDNRGGNLNAHHIKPFSDYPELRFAIDNGITLCKRCHTRIHLQDNGWSDEDISKLKTYEASKLV